MSDHRQFEFFLLRYVPDAVKGEFVNIGVLMLESGANAAYADLRLTRDWRRVRCLDPAADIEMLLALEKEIRQQLSSGDRWQFLERLQTSLGNAVQISAGKACLAEDPAREMSLLSRMYLEAPRPGAKHEMGSRQRILHRMRNAFEQAGVWALLAKEIPAEKYTWPGDPLKIDCGYRPDGVFKLFQAVSLAAGIDPAKVLAFTYPPLADGIMRVEKASTLLTAVVEDDLNRSDEQIGFALRTLESNGIQIVDAAAMPRLAEHARIELRA